MNNKFKYIETVAREGKFSSYCDIITAGTEWARDLESEVYLIALQKDESKLPDNAEETLYYLMRIARTQFNSGTSEFYRGIKRFKQESVEFIEVDDYED